MDNKAELLRLLRLAWAADHVSAADCRKIDTILAAPAEDVRAVVEEPVAWVVNWADSGEKYCVVEPGWRAERLLADPDFKATPLYRHPQRPVVLPEPEPVSYTCIGKGGRYEILGLATGAGLTRGEDRLVYRDISTSRLFLRTEADFSQRMERLNKC